MISPDCSHLTRPAVFDAQNAIGLGVVEFGAGGRLQNNGLHAKEWQSAGTGLGICGAGQRGHQMAAGFGLPPCVYNRSFALADHIIVPIPSFRIDRLTHRAEYFD